MTTLIPISGMSGDMHQEHIDHVNYPERLKALSLSSLWAIAKDAHEAERLNPNGPKAGYYLDEINYVANEIHRRRFGNGGGK